MEQIVESEHNEEFSKNNEIENYELKYNWVLWFHKVNDSNWTLSSYSKVFEIKTYFDVLFIIKEIENISSGMFFLMKEGINPIYEDTHNINGGYWSMRISKKESFDFWQKMIFYMCLDKLTINETYEEKINGISISPKINNCIFKIWNSDFKGMNTKSMRHDLDFINWLDTFYLEHKEN
jgi:hypothetical protein